METFVVNIPMGNMIIQMVGWENIKLHSEIAATPHQHSDFELHFILQGKAVVNVGNKCLQVKRNSILCIPSNQMHYASFYSNDYQECAFTFSLKQSKKARRSSEYEIFSEAFNIKEGIVLKLSAENRVLVNSMLGTVTSFRFYSFYKFNAIISVLLLNIAHDLSELNEKHDFDIHPSSYGDIVARKMVAEEYIYSHVYEKITLDDMANYIALSPRQTIRFIQSAFGMSFTELVTKIRMLTAKELLQDRQKSMSEIAGALGYQSYSAFYAAYRRYFGESPKKSHPKEND